ncbi:MAG: DNA polymerase III subunit epsilon [Pseudomonadota bacterium]
MVREIVLDTETTGLDAAEGHRVVEIGCVELVNHLRTGRDFHVYINPERSMPADAFRIHGLSDAFLRDKPRFAEIATEFLRFIAEDRLLIHNAAFDIGMLNAEFARLGIAEIPMARALDTAGMARRRYPGAHVSLDALCKRFGVDNSGREKHGALLDSELLADVYLELLGGRQQGLTLDAGPSQGAGSGDTVARAIAHRARPRPLAPRLTEAEAAAHAAFVEDLGDSALWRRAGSAGEG